MMCSASYPYFSMGNLGLNGVSAAVPREAQTARLRLGMPAEDWEDTDAAWLWPGDPRGFKKKSIRRGGEDWEFGLTWVESTAQGLEVSYISQIKRNAEARLVAVDAEGKTYFPSLTGYGTLYLPSFLDRTEPYSVCFAGFNLAHLKELRFQVRPYRWAEFKNISLRPGQRTQVEVKDFGATVSGVTSQPARPAGVAPSDLPNHSTTNTAPSGDANTMRRDLLKHHSWDITYNLTTNLTSLADRWRLIQYGIEQLRDEGLKQFPDDLAIVEPEL